MEYVSADLVVRLSLCDDRGLQQTGGPRPAQHRTGVYASLSAHPRLRRHETPSRLVKAYNQIIGEYESDPGLHIEYNG
ncbi:hypothetical protein GCM10008901_08050 [Bifidobacterium pullorum]